MQIAQQEVNHGQDYLTHCKPADEIEQKAADWLEAVRRRVRRNGINQVYRASEWRVPMSVDVSDMVSGPYKYEKDLHACFRVVLPEQGGRLVACVYATEGEDQAEAEAMLFARALRKANQPGGYRQYTDYRP
jgi:hypothetical protein